jgi:O-antigen ligase
MAIAAVGCSAYAVVFAGERGTLVALALTLVALGLIEGRRMRAVCFLVAAVTVVGITSRFLAERAGLPSDLARRYSAEEMARTGGSGRVGIWTNALALFMRSPLVGSGLNTFHEQDAYRAYRDPRFMSVHNDLLGIAVDLGVVGALLYFALMGTAIVRPLRVRSKTSLSQYRVLPLVVSALMMYLVGSGLTSRFFYAKTFWLLLGLSYAVTRVPDSATEYGSAAVSSEPPTPRSACSSPVESRQ